MRPGPIGFSTPALLYGCTSWTRMLPRSIGCAAAAKARKTGSWHWLGSLIPPKSTPPAWWRSLPTHGL
jgi:hypothetical protein